METERARNRPGFPLNSTVQSTARQPEQDTNAFSLANLLIKSNCGTDTTIHLHILYSRMDRVHIVDPIHVCIHTRVCICVRGPMRSERIRARERFQHEIV